MTPLLCSDQWASALLAAGFATLPQVGRGANDRGTEGKTQDGVVLADFVTILSNTQKISSERLTHIVKTSKGALTQQAAELLVGFICLLMCVPNQARNTLP